MDPPKDDASGSPQSEGISQPNVLVRLIDARPPFPILATTVLRARPQLGENIWLPVATGVNAGYRVTCITFFPNRTAQLDIECLPLDALNPPASAPQKQAIDELVDRNVKVFEKAQAYTNVIILAGYAGSLGIWSLYKDKLTDRAVSIVALLIGMSLLFFVSWELLMMIVRTLEAKRLFDRTDSPDTFVAQAAEYRRLDRKNAARIGRAWLVTLLPTILLGYAGILILFWNAAADLTGLPKWP